MRRKDYFFLMILTIAPSLNANYWLKNTLNPTTSWITNLASQAPRPDFTHSKQDLSKEYNDQRSWIGSGSLGLAAAVLSAAVVMSSWLYQKWQNYNKKPLKKNEPRKQLIKKKNTQPPGNNAKEDPFGKWNEIFTRGKVIHDNQTVSTGYQAYLDYYYNYLLQKFSNPESIATNKANHFELNENEKIKQKSIDLFVTGQAGIELNKEKKYIKIHQENFNVFIENIFNLIQNEVVALDSTLKIMMNEAKLEDSHELLKKYTEHFITVWKKAYLLNKNKDPEITHFINNMLLYFKPIRGLIEKANSKN